MYSGAYICSYMSGLHRVVDDNKGLGRAHVADPASYDIQSFKRKLR